MFWGDMVLNGIQPLFVMSSNWTNVNNLCGHIPLIINPDCGRQPDAILFNFTLTTFMLVPMAIGMSKLVNRVRSGRPTPSTGGTLGLIVAIAMILCLGEILFLSLGLWAYAGPRWMGFSPGHGGTWHPIVWLETGLFFAAVCALYISKNDKGQRVVERGLEHHSPNVRTAITMMALYTSLQLALWIPGSVPTAAVSFFQDGWAKMPNHLVNDTCDAPGVTGTRYGPCPGSPGYKMPVRHSLPGQSP